MENITSAISHHNVNETPTPFFFLPYLFILVLPMFFPKFLDLVQKKLSNQLHLPLPPGPKPWPLVGCLPAMLKKKSVFRWIHNLMEDLDTRIACIRLGNVHVIAVTCPEIACQFLKTQNSVFSSRPLNMSTQIVSIGYLSASHAPLGEQWKKMKRVLVSEMLSPAKHKFFHGKRVEVVDHLVRYLYNQYITKTNNGGGLEINVRWLSRHYCGNLLRNIMFNKRSLRKICEDGELASFEDEEQIDAFFAMHEHVHAFGISDFWPWFNFDGHVKQVLI